MFNIKLIREDPELVRKNIRRRRDKTYLNLLNQVIKDDKKLRKLIAEANKLRSERNKISLEIAKLKKAGKNTKAKRKVAESIPKKLKIAEAEKTKVEAKVKDALMRIPNMLHESVPYGKDDSENVEIKRWGKEPKFDFKPKSHLEILQNLGLIDVERGVKVAGHQFFYLKDELVLLDLAIQRFAIDFLRNKGFTLINPPYMINRRAYSGMIDPSDFEMVTYKVEGEDFYLIATSEHPMGAIYMNETLNKSQLPIKFCGVSPCFRKEVGAHGKYTRGLFRMHQFHKIEQFIFCLPEESWKFHEELQKNSEELYQKLGIHYRVVNICTGDIGTIAAKKYDIEAWMADGDFREVGSNSNCTDYQARRLNTRYREKEGQPPKGFVHTLNNTALATSRTMIAIIEQNQQKDGSVLIPKILHPFMDGIKKLEKK